MKPAQWTPDEDRLLREFYPYHQTETIKEKFPGRSLTAVRSRAKVLKLRKIEDWRKRKKIWTPEMEAELKRLYPELTATEIAGRLGMTVCTVKSAVGKFRLKKGTNSGCFRKGHIPMNKGKKQEEYCTPEAIERMKATRFKKGRFSHNRLEIGSERIDSKDGYTYVKVRDGAFNRNYKQKHHIIWESHNGPIPKGFAVRFKDGDRSNFEISNLELVSRKELAMRNCHDFPEEIKKMWQLKGALNRQLNKINRNTDNGKRDREISPGNP